MTLPKLSLRLKCLGASGRLVFRVYMIQVMAMAAAGTLAGLAVGWAAPALGLSLAGNYLPVVPVVGVYAEPLALAALFGVLISATFATWPVARAREVPAAQLFRDRIAPAGVRPRWVYIGATAIGGLGLAALVLLTASDPRAARRP